MNTATLPDRPEVSAVSRPGALVALPQADFLRYGPALARACPTLCRVRLTDLAPRRAPTDDGREAWCWYKPRIGTECSRLSPELWAALLPPGDHYAVPWERIGVKTFASEALALDALSTACLRWAGSPDRPAGEDLLPPTDPAVLPAAAFTDPAVAVRPVGVVLVLPLAQWMEYGPALVRAAPLARVELTDAGFTRRRLNRPDGDGHRWPWVWASCPPGGCVGDEGLPAGWFVHLTPGDVEGAGLVSYPTLKQAADALSQACIDWARAVTPPA
jgi:hypothetical protein